MVFTSTAAICQRASSPPPSPSTRRTAYASDPRRFPEDGAETFDALVVALDLYDRVVNIALPVTLSSEVLNWTKSDNPESFEIPIEVTYQICSDTVRYPPNTKPLTVEGPVSARLMPGAVRRPEERSSFSGRGTQSTTKTWLGLTLGGTARVTKREDISSTVCRPHGTSRPGSGLSGLRSELS